MASEQDKMRQNEAHDLPNQNKRENGLRWLLFQLQVINVIWVVSLDFLDFDFSSAFFNWLALFNNKLFLKIKSHEGQKKVILQFLEFRVFHHFE